MHDSAPPRPMCCTGIQVDFLDNRKVKVPSEVSVDRSRPDLSKVAIFAVCAITITPPLLRRSSALKIVAGVCYLNPLQNRSPVLGTKLLGIRVNLAPTRECDF